MPGLSSRAAPLALLLRARPGEGSPALAASGAAASRGSLGGSLGFEQELQPVAPAILGAEEALEPAAILRAEEAPEPEEELRAGGGPGAGAAPAAPPAPLGRAAELRRGYEALESGVRRSAQVLRQSIQVQQEAARALAGDARVRREHAQTSLRHDELQLQEALAWREHEALLEENTQLHRELARAPAGLGRNALYGIVLSAVLALGSCTFWGLGLLRATPREPEDHDEDAKLFIKAHKRRNINGVSHTFAQNVALLITFVVGGFVGLCWMGSVQHMMRQVVCLGFFTLVLLGFLYVFLHEFWSEFAEKHKDIMKLVKTVACLFEGGMFDVKDDAVSFFRTSSRR